MFNMDHAKPEAGVLESGAYAKNAGILSVIPGYTFVRQLISKLTGCRMG
jgi:hypothetical protein